MMAYLLVSSFSLMQKQSAPFRWGIYARMLERSEVNEHNSHLRLIRIILNSVFQRHILRSHAFRLTIELDLSYCRPKTVADETIHIDKFVCVSIKLLEHLLSMCGTFLMLKSIKIRCRRDLVMNKRAIKFHKPWQPVKRVCSQQNIKYERYENFLRFAHFCSIDF